MLTLNKTSMLLINYLYSIICDIRWLIANKNRLILLFMAALCNRAGHYIFALWFLLSSIFFLAYLSGRRVDVYHTSTHGVALVRI